jgi:ABC-2 type transport system permease protein
MGTIEQLIVSPLRPVELIVGKTVPYVLIGLLDVALILTIGHFLFQLPIRGSLFVLFAAVLIYLLTTVGLGLLISTFSRTQQQAMLSTMFALAGRTAPAPPRHPHLHGQPAPVQEEAGVT